MYVNMYVCMYVCTYVCMHIKSSITNIHNLLTLPPNDNFVHDCAQLVVC